MEEARTEFLLAKDISLKDYQKKGIWFVVKKVEIEYIYSAKYMDEICISCWLEKLKNFSFVFLQEVFFKDKKFASSKIKIVCVDNNFRLLKIPDIIADKINS